MLPHITTVRCESVESYRSADTRAFIRPPAIDINKLSTLQLLLYYTLVQLWFVRAMAGYGNTHIRRITDAYPDMGKRMTGKNLWLTSRRCTPTDRLVIPAATGWETADVHGWDNCNINSLITKGKSLAFRVCITWSFAEILFSSFTLRWHDTINKVVMRFG